MLRIANSRVVKLAGLLVAATVMAIIAAQSQAGSAQSQAGSAQSQAGSAQSQAGSAQSQAGSGDTSDNQNGDLARLFPVFAEDGVPADAIPDRLASSLRDATPRTPALDVDASRFVQAGRDDDVLYLVPTDDHDGVCTAYVLDRDVASSTTCATLGELEGGAVAFGELLAGCKVDASGTEAPTCEGNIVSGLAPGATSVELTLGSGEGKAVPVSGGVFVTVLEGQEYVDSAGALK